MELSNARIFLTGSSRGIGHSLARYLLEHGARVALHYNSSARETEMLLRKFPSSGSRMYQADLSDPTQCVRMWKEIIQDFKTIDSIILNAGVFLPQQTYDPDLEWIKTWRKTMAINLDSSGLFTKWGIEHFKRSGGGRFIYIGSRAVFRGETEEYLAYAASKGGLVSLARSVARSFGKYNIKSFVLSPGFVKTAMAEQFIASHGSEKVLNELALNEMTSPEHLAPLVGLMCSGAMDHATGATIDMNAGSHIR